jgi:hypothetical protein
MSAVRSILKDCVSNIVSAGQETTCGSSMALDTKAEVCELNAQVLEDFRVELSLEKTLERLKIDERRSRSLGVENIFKMGVSLVHPRAIYATGYVSKHSVDKTEIKDTGFSSRVLAKNLEHVERVFPYVLTIGDLLENTARSSESITAKLVLDAVGDLALGSALEHLQRHISGQYGLETTSHMGPGQLDWPITQQRELFSILGRVKDKIGVTLTESLMMVPRKSISGIIFPTEETFISCQLCQRNKCPSRKAPFDTDLSKKYAYDQAVDRDRTQQL